MAFQPSNDWALLIASQASRPARMVFILAAAAFASASMALSSSSGRFIGGRVTGGGAPENLDLVERHALASV